MALRDQASQMDQAQALGQLGRWPKMPAPAFKPDVYANRVEVERHEHDATLRFFRDGKSTGKQVGEVIVPLAVLDTLKET